MENRFTPMMQQYMAVKNKYKDCLVFFRLGDFYELFFDDALVASRVLGITLTKKSCGTEEKAPMCGVPYHAVDTYLRKLIKEDFKVAICEQLTDPSESKGIVERDVIRVVTPGTVIEDVMLDDKENNFILSISFSNSKVGLAFADVSTGDFYIEELNEDEITSQLSSEIFRINPKEIIINDEEYLKKPKYSFLSDRGKYFISPYHKWAFEYETAYKALLRHFNTLNLDGFGCMGYTDGIRAGGALIEYLCDTQKNSLSHINSITPYETNRYMKLDEHTRRNLELTRTIMHGSKKGSLLSVLDKTQTPMGGRLLHRWLEQPLQSKVEIDERLNAVCELYDDLIKRDEISALLNEIYDIERITSKIAYGSINPKDCIMLSNSLDNLPSLKELLKNVSSNILKECFMQLDPMEDINELLKSAIIDEPPTAVKEGGIIKVGYNSEVDTLRDATINGRKWIAKLEATEREETGIKNLKIGYNKVFGYYIEVTKSYYDQVPYRYTRKQTLANAERYVTDELKEIENIILNAEDKLIKLEYELFNQIKDNLSEQINRIKNTSKVIAQIDAITGLANTAYFNGYTKPLINEEGLIEIKAGKHPTVERGVTFVPNDTYLDCDQDRFIIITGPNMAGKSTYMRQVALITLMAHIGSFVPATFANIGVVDRIFTRVGASDNISSGESTFMVEMNEVANILNNATNKSLVILDEVGRGTSTYDGLSIAWAITEYISDKNLIGAKTLFATHYHELSDLEGKLDGVVNYMVEVKEVGEDVVFLHKILKGSVDKSFGIHVAGLAGIPPRVLARAKQILNSIESNNLNQSLTDIEIHTETKVDSKYKDVINEILKLDVNKMTPITALNYLFELYFKVQAEEDK